MTIYILQEGISDGEAATKGRTWTQGWKEERVFLDDRLHKGNTVLQEIEADSWLEARDQVPDFI